MPLTNATRAQQEAEADRELRKKLSLERDFIVLLEDIFKELSDAIISAYEENQQAPDIFTYNARLADAIAAHNARVASEFGGSLVEFLSSPASADSQLGRAVDQMALEQGVDRSQIVDEVALLAALATDQLVKNVTNFSSDRVSTTNAAAIESAILAAEQTALASEDDETTRDIAELAAALFLADALRRAPTIAATTTQQTAEGVKEEEAESVKNSVIVAAVATGALAATFIDPVWTTVGDDRVRDAHAAADGQRRGEEGIPGAFLVGGEALRYPGDPNGSAENTINCRCSAIFVSL